MEGKSTCLLLFWFLFFHKFYAAELDLISDSQFLTDGDTLVSQTGVFELGFFRPDISTTRYLGIWFKNISVRTVVWVANRDHPVLSASSPLMLKIVEPGILALFDNISMVWSSNTTMTSTKNATVKLHDNGNLVMMDQLHEKMMWQSFDYPTDTLLFGMKLGKDYVRGIEWHLSSWKSSRDPAPGEFTWGADITGYPESKLKQGKVVKFRGGPWTNRRINGYTAYNGTSTLATTTYTIILTKNEVSFSVFVENSSLLDRVVLSSAGDLEAWTWAEDSKKWDLSLRLPTDICDTYNYCGAYGSCSVNLAVQSCTCLDEKRFVPRDRKGWETANWSGGCVRRTPLVCKNESEGFIKYSNVKLPDTKDTWYNMSMTLEQCAEKCLQNCSCVAYANPETRFAANGCVLWFSDLLDIRVQEGSVGRDIFIKMASSELDVQSVSRKKRGAKTKIILTVFFTGILVVGLISISLWYARIKRNNVPTIEGSFRISKDRKEDIQLPLFSFSTIATATASFSLDNMLGEGGFGQVYKGVLEEGLEIAAKRLSRTSNQGVDEFKNEVICVSRLQHRNLVKLLGCCINEGEKLLIYEYMPNKSLDSIIFDGKQSMLLDWTKRFNIIKGIARGLLYLHHDSRLRIIHRDLKASNILLDRDMNPKISDFGMARCFGGSETQANTQRVVGTYGYMSPEYVKDGIFSIKSDVFSFGVLILEIVSGKRNRGFIHPAHDNNLIGHAWSAYNEGRSMELIDDTLAESCNPVDVLKSINVGLLCVQQDADDRPNVTSVVKMLDADGELPQPKPPAFFMGRDLFVADFYSSSNPVGSFNGLTITQLDAR